MNEELYVIGDVHGCYKSLKALVNKLPKQKRSNIVFVGDLIDRGKNSKDVLQYIIDNGFQSVLGNHEDFLLSSIKRLNKGNQHNFDSWIKRYGGDATIASYGYNNLDILEDETFQNHLKFLKNLPLFLEFPNCKTEDGRHVVVSHSSVGDLWEFRETKNKGTQKLFRENILTNRPNKVPDNKTIYNVFGHTHLKEADIKNHYGNIDTGCVYGNFLSALEVSSQKIYRTSY